MTDKEENSLEIIATSHENLFYPSEQIYRDIGGLGV